MSETLTISEKELLETKLSEEVEELRTTKRNLETQIIALERQKKAEKDIDNVKQMEVRNQALKALADAKISVLKEKSEWQRKNERLDDQRIMLEKTESEIGNVEQQLRKLQSERAEIYELRKQTNELMRQAKEAQGEVDGFKQSQEAMKQNLESQINLNKKTYKEYMDLVGEVNVREKAVKVREANCKA